MSRAGIQRRSARRRALFVQRQPIADAPSSASRGACEFVVVPAAGREVAKALDRELRRLAGIDAQVRVVQAKLAARFLEGRSWRPLGFVRLSDWCRERLGISPRALEEDARMMKMLAKLPLLRLALEGGLLGWTALRILLRFATPANQARLLDLARGRPTRELEGLLREKILGDAVCDTAGGAAGGIAEDFAREISGVAGQCTGAAPASSPGDAGDDPELRWSIVVSRAGRRIWRAAAELASRCAGAPLGNVDVLEAVLAEAMSSAPLSRSSTPAVEHFARTLRRRECREVPTIGATGTVAIDPGSHEAEGAASLSKLEALITQAACAPAERVDHFATPPSSLGALDLPLRLDGLLHDLSHADAFELDFRLRRCRSVLQRIDAQLATLLRIGVDDRLFRELGFPTMKAYVAARLDFCARRAWSLVAIERASCRVGEGFRRAWRDGEISLLAATTLLPVVGGLQLDAWLERAKVVTLRRLHDEVAWALDQMDRAASAAIPAPPTEGALLVLDASARVVDDEVQMRAHGELAGHRAPPAGAARLDLRAPLSLLSLLELALHLYGRDGEPRWRCFERMVSTVLLHWAATPRHRDPIFERDGWRCSVPGCSSRRNLHDHHVLYRSRGGRNTRDNRITVCAAHHLHGIHAGIVRVRGRAPTDLVWELGCRPGAAPLLRVRGERSGIPPLATAEESCAEG